MYYPSRSEFIKLAKGGNLIPVYKEVAVGLEIPLSAFMKIDTKGDYTYLLESMEGGEKIARYSFLGSSPSLVFKSKGKKIEILERTKGKGLKSKKFITKKDPLFEIKRLMQNYEFVRVKGLPRFCGGLVGYMGYDMVRFFEDIPDNNPDDLCLPDSLFVLTDTILIFDHLKSRIKIVSNAYTVNTKSLKELGGVYDRAVEKIEAIARRLKRPLNTVILKTKSRVKKQKKNIKIKSNFNKKAFEAIVNKAKKYIKAGEIIQAVLSQRFETRLLSPPMDIYRALRSINPSPYMYYLKFDSLHLIGSSPELMVRCEAGGVEVRPIAGTRPRGKDKNDDRRLARSLLSDPKECAEHLMLVDLGRNDIGRVSRYGTVKVPEFMVIEKYSHVMHIVSDTVGKLAPGKDSFDVIRSTFPAGTVTGAPKIRAMQIIDELENVRRGPYAGMVGYFSFSGNLDTCITIRTIMIKDKRAFVQAGAGIVADSVPGREYDETAKKARAMIKAIELAAGGSE